MSISSRTIHLFVAMALITNQYTFAQSPDKPTQLELDRDLSMQLKKQFVCEDLDESGRNSCFLRYNGTVIEVVNPAKAHLPNIYVHSLGKGHSVLPRSGRCLEWMLDNEPKAAGNTISPASVLINSTGHIWASLDRKLRMRCETE